VPVFATFVPENEHSLRKMHNIIESDLGAALGNDMVKDCVGLKWRFFLKPDDVYVDDWGMTWRYVCNDFGVFTEIADFPLAGDKVKLESFTIPDPDEQTQYEPFKQLKNRYG